MKKIQSSFKKDSLENKDTFKDKDFFESIESLNNLEDKIVKLYEKNLPNKFSPQEIEVFKENLDITILAIKEEKDENKLINEFLKYETGKDLDFLKGYCIYFMKRNVLEKSGKVVELLSKFDAMNNLPEPQKEKSEKEEEFNNKSLEEKAKCLYKTLYPNTTEEEANIDYKMAFGMFEAENEILKDSLKNKKIFKLLVFRFECFFMSKDNIKYIKDLKKIIMQEEENVTNNQKITIETWKQLLSKTS